MGIIRTAPLLGLFLALVAPVCPFVPQTLHPWSTVRSAEYGMLGGDAPGGSQAAVCPRARRRGAEGTSLCCMSMLEVPGRPVGSVGYHREGAGVLGQPRGGGGGGERKPGGGLGAYWACLAARMGALTVAGAGASGSNQVDQREQEADSLDASGTEPRMQSGGRSLANDGERRAAVEEKKEAAVQAAQRAAIARSPPPPLLVPFPLLPNLASGSHPWRGGFCNSEPPRRPAPVLAGGRRGGRPCSASLRPRGSGWAPRGSAS